MSYPPEEQRASNHRVMNALLGLAVLFCLGYAALIVRNLLLGVIASCLVLLTYIFYLRLQIERRRELRTAPVDE